MKQFAQFLLIAVASYFTQLYLPWWSMVVVAALAGFVFAFEKSRRSFYSGFFAVLVLYLAVAWLANTANAGVFLQKTETVFGSMNNVYLFLVPAFLGGVLAGFGSLTGNLLRNLIVRK